ncbi:ABC transporter substrate-binding protein [Microbacterium sp.]|uniref:ABC transporter substrate-binding protein n=1 Tax=Microbacterium sp. TaxID=51671 RepID=UPI00334130B8
MKESTWRRGLAIGLAAAVLATIAGCAASPDADGGKKKDSIIVVQQADIASLSTNIASQRTASRVAGEINEAAVKITFDGDKPKLVPGLAESWEQKDEHTWRFTVRPDVTFTNGEKLTAAAFKSTLEQYRQDPAGKVTTIMKNVQINVVDEMTFDVVTEESNLGSLPVQMTWMAVLPPEYRGSMTEAAFGDAPIGTGPYMLDEWKKGISVTLKANPDYWGEKPAIKKVTVQTVPDAATRVGMLETGAADLVSDITPDMIKRAEGIPGTTVKWGASDTRSTLVLNTNTAPTDNLLVRQAINYAVDKESLAKSLFGGHATPISSPIVKGELGYDPDLDEYPYDPEKAKQLLAEAGYPNGVAIDLNYTIGTSVQDQKVGEALQAMLEAVGFTVNMKGGAFATLQPTWREPGKSSGIYTMTFGPVYPDSSFLFNKAYFHPDAVYGTVWTKTDDTLTALSDKALTTSDEKERQDLYEQAAKRVMDEALWVPMFNYQNGYAMVEGLDWKPVPDNRFYFENASFR